MKIINYPHPTLRHTSKKLRRVDGELKRMVRRMFELMYEAQGAGLAANQVDLPLRLFVVNLAANPNDGEELVFINPVLSSPKGLDEAEEGCLSFPDLYAPVRRPASIKVNAYDLEGKEIDARLDGFLARIVQHENDHLDGVLFTDRMSETVRLQVQADLERFERTFEHQRRKGEIPDDHQIAARLAEIEQKYC